MLLGKVKLKSLPYLNMSLPIGNIYLKEVMALLFVRMLTLNLQRLSRSILTKEACLPAIIVASAVTSNLIIHRSMLRSLRSRSKSQRKQNQTIKLPRLIKLLDISSNIPRDLFRPTINVARLVTTNPGASSQSPVSPKITISMKGY
jgi:hypothetical protein